METNNILRFKGYYVDLLGPSRRKAAAPSRELTPDEVNLKL